MDMNGVFDNSGALRGPTYRELHRELTSFVSYNPERAVTDGLPHGNGHTVLVLPGLLTTDAFTLALRRFLDACGYRSEGWEMGTNWGPTPRILGGLRDRLHALNDREGGPVSVVGVSMGGILARNLAHDHPERIRKLATIVSPVRFPTASSLEPLVRLLSPFYSPVLWDPTGINSGHAWFGQLPGWWPSFIPFSLSCYSIIKGLDKKGPLLFEPCFGFYPVIIQ